MVGTPCWDCTNSVLLRSLDNGGRAGYQWSQPRPPLPTGHSSSPPHTCARARGVYVCLLPSGPPRPLQYRTLRPVSSGMSFDAPNTAVLCPGWWGLSRASETIGDRKTPSGGARVRVRSELGCRSVTCWALICTCRGLLWLNLLLQRLRSQKVGVCEYNFVVEGA